MSVVAAVAVGLCVTPTSAAPRKGSRVPTAATLAPQLIVETEHAGPIQSIAFSPDGRFLLTADRSDVRLWDVASRRLLRNVQPPRVDEHTPHHTLLAFCPDGSCFAAARSPFDVNHASVPTVGFWSLDKPGTQPREVLHVYDFYTLNRIDISPDGYRLVAFGQGRSGVGGLFVWDRRSRRYLGWTRRYPSLTAGALSSDGRRIFLAERPTWKPYAADTFKLSVVDVATGAILNEVRTTGSPLELPSSARAVTLGGEVWMVDAESAVASRLSGDGSPQVGGVPYAVLRRSDAILLAVGGRHPGLWTLPSGAHLADFREGSSALSPAALEGAQPADDSSIGQEPFFLEMDPDRVNTIAFSPDGKLIGTGDGAGRVLIRDTSRHLFGETVGRGVEGVETLACSSDAKRVVLGSAVWDLSTGQPSWRVPDPEEGRLRQATDCASKSGLLAVLDVEDTDDQSGEPRQPAIVRVFQIDDGRQLIRFESPGALSLAFSPSEALLAIGGHEELSVVHATSGIVAQTISAPGSDLHVVGWAAKGAEVLGVTRDVALRWNVSSGLLENQFGFNDGSETAPSYHGFVLPAFSRDGTHLAAVSDGCLVGPGTKAYRTGAYVWDGRTGNLRRRLLDGCEGGWELRALAISADGRRVLVGDESGRVRALNAATGRLLATFHGDVGPVSAVVETPDARTVITCGWDGTVRFWDAVTGTELARVVSFSDGGWIVVDPKGRFDTNRLEGVAGVHWIVPDDPLHAMPFEAFMREYYEPRLLSRVLARESMRPVRALAELNRGQPLVRIISAEMETAIAAPGPRRLLVTVEVERSEGRIRRHGKTAAATALPYDLRVFRDGKLVGRAPADTGAVAVDPLTGCGRLQFRVSLPSEPKDGNVEISAYVFNQDGVKSVAARLTVPVARRQSRTVRAYVIAMGVNGHQNPAFDLSFAANDARTLAATLSASLGGLATYEEVVAVPLISDTSGTRREGEAPATKAALRSALAILGGGDVDPDLMRSLPDSTGLRPAGPDDVVVISFSGHGLVDSAGIFYMVPHDTGFGSTKTFTPELLTGSISSDELSAWLRGVDAGELLLIVDACHSAAAVEAGGFKAGPLGSRGLGQLAYDKGMRVLVAAQTDEVAIEDGRIRHGLLTYALAREGLERDMADGRPPDGSIGSAEWLRYAARRVPGLYQDVLYGRSRGVTLVRPAAKLRVQSPGIFDFSKDQSGITVRRKRIETVPNPTHEPGGHP